jgi:hypothetical protein
VSAGTLDHVYEALGANAEPSAAHWIRFFGWIDEQSDSGARRLQTATRKALRSAYSKLGSLPVGVPSQARVFLDTRGRLHSKADVRASHYLINDDPRAADAVTTAGLPVAFADVVDASTRAFYRSSGVLLLTEARRHIGVKVGDQRPRWLLVCVRFVHELLSWQTPGLVVGPGGRRCDPWPPAAPPGAARCWCPLV